MAVAGASAVHPWWNNGRPQLSRFWGWAYGDGALIHLYPELTYLAPPNAPEAALCLPVGLILLHLGSGMWPWLPRPTPKNACAALLGLATGELLAETLTHMVFERSRHREDSTLPLRLAAIPHALAVRVASEAGRVYGHLMRGKVTLLLRRFDWFVGLHPGLFSVERRAATFRIGCWVAASAAIGYAWQNTC